MESESADEGSAPLLPVRGPRDGDARTNNEETVCVCTTNLHGWIWNNGVACAVMAAFFLSWANVGAKTIKDGVPALQVMAMQSFGAIVVLFVLSFFFRWTPLFGKRESWCFLIMEGLLYGLMLGSQYISMFKIAISNTVTIRSLNTAIAAILLWVIKREPLGWQTISGIVFCFVGVVLVVHPSIIFPETGNEELSEDRIWGIVFAGLSAVFMALMSTMIRLIGKSERPVTLQIWAQTGILIVAVVPLAFSWPQAIKWEVFSEPKDMLIVVCVIACILFGVFFFVRALQLLFAAFATALASLMIIFVALWEFIILKTPVTLLGGLGSLVMIVGLFIMSLESKGKPKPRGVDGEEADEEQVVRTGLICGIRWVKLEDGQMGLPVQ